MRLSRTRRAFMISFSLIMAGLLGQAAAAQTVGPQAAAPTPTVTAAPANPSASAPSTAKPSTTKPGTAQTSAKPYTTDKRAESTTVTKGKGRAAGPAGSLMTTGSQAVALTFDDGPDPATTPALLDLLDEQHVKATFCLVGSNAKKFPNLVRDIVDAGHTVCNHTWNHDLKLGKKSKAQIKADMEKTNAAILKAAPNATIAYFRAPGGKFNAKVVQVAADLGMSSLYWKVDPRDWDHPKGETHAKHQQKVIKAVQKYTHQGSIVLSHDYAQPDTIKAYRTLIPWLKKKYKLIALPI
ncbi:polysaccharide deacetylase family protein [Actinoplanes sp. NPDC051851]|uniref:polysaccharide deacetylase family protein n=1 Tax=Actinoplanes sp. NPDC051851 TaxID=3154753 RepID=UPI0034433DAF